MQVQCLIFFFFFSAQGEIIFILMCLFWMLIIYCMLHKIPVSSQTLDKTSGEICLWRDNQVLERLTSFRNLWADNSPHLNQCLALFLQMFNAEKTLVTTSTLSRGQELPLNKTSTTGEEHALSRQIAHSRWWIVIDCFFPSCHHLQMWNSVM